MKIGKLSESVLQRSVLREIKTTREDVISGAAVGGDCALFALSDDAVLAVSTQEGPVMIPSQKDEAGFHIEELVIKALNGVAVQGASPAAVTLTFFFSEQVQEQDIKALMREAESVLHPQGVMIMGGQSCVTARCDGVLAAVTAYGKRGGVQKNAPKAGMDIVLSKWIGLEGTALLAQRRAEQIRERYPSYLVEEAQEFCRYLSVLPEAAIAGQTGVCLMHDASKGGIFAALWEMAQSAGVGLKVDLKKLPLRQETVEICEELGVNPYKLLSGGCLIMVTPNGEELAEALMQQGIHGVCVGTITEGNDRILVNEEEIRYLEKPEQDEIYRIFRTSVQ